MPKNNLSELPWKMPSEPIPPNELVMAVINSRAYSAFGVDVIGFGLEVTAWCHLHEIVASAEAFRAAKEKEKS